MRAEERSGVCVVSPTGDVDVATASFVLDAVLDGVSNRSRGAVLDLTEVRYLDSAGVRMIFTLADRLSWRRQVLRLVVAPSGAARRVVEIAGLAESVPVDPTVEAAVESIVAASAR